MRLSPVLWSLCFALCVTYSVLGDEAASLGFIEDFKVGSTMCNNHCSGHGNCVSRGTGPVCECDMGWGSEYDITAYRSPSCDTRVCPAGDAWASAGVKRGIDAYGEGIVTSHELRECSNVGLCNRVTGECDCPPGYFGPACERKGCPNDCSGHGQCLSMEKLANKQGGFPLSRRNVNDSYALFLGLGQHSNGSYIVKAWDAHKIFGCLCDSSWEVGLGAGQSQESEWFGPDCSLKHCPSGDDPLTRNITETDCWNITADGGEVGEFRTNGSAGNLCHVDCANRGICDYSSGQCHCFAGFYGHDCTIQSALAGGNGEISVMDMEVDYSDFNRQRDINIKGGGVDDSGDYFNDDVPNN